jgi:hypothetical protein
MPESSPKVKLPKISGVDKEMSRKRKKTKERLKSFHIFSHFAGQISLFSLFSFSGRLHGVNI